MKAFLLKLKAKRIHLTQIFAVLLFIYLVISKNLLEEKTVLLGGALFMIGVVMVAIGVIGRAWSLSYISGNKGKKIVKDGPYSLCRNPLYLFSFLGAVGLGFCTETVTVPLVILISFSIYYPLVIRKEEKFLQSKFGDEFLAYKQAVPKFFPSFKNFSEDEEIFLKPKAFRRGLFDLTYFIIFIGFFELTEALHESGLFEGFLSIY